MRSVNEHRTPASRAPNSRLRNLCIFLAIAAAVVAADLTLKHVIFAKAAAQPTTDHRLIASPTTLIPHVLSLQPNTNEGAVFGIGAGGRVVFIIVAAIAVLVILGIAWRNPVGPMSLRVSLGLILGGAVGNLYDRIVHGLVRDMLYLFPDVNLPFGWRWHGGSREIYPWIFNIADVALVTGVLIIVVRSLVRSIRQPSTPPHQRSR